MLVNGIHSCAICMRPGWIPVGEPRTWLCKRHYGSSLVFAGERLRAVEEYVNGKKRTHLVVEVLDLFADA